MRAPANDNPNYMIPDYFENPVIRPYLRNVRDWQGYIRFLGLPDRRDNPDIIIDRLFVAPVLTRRHVSPTKIRRAGSVMRSRSSIRSRRTRRSCFWATPALGNPPC